MPLRNAIIPRGSRSIIVEHLDGPTQLVLAPHGQDRIKFEYGVFLLNKNIEVTNVFFLRTRSSFPSNF